MEGKVIYPTSDEKDVSSKIFYINPENPSILYEDREFSKPVSKKDAIDLFVKKLIVAFLESEEIYVIPVGIVPVEEDSYGMIYYFPDSD